MIDHVVMLVWSIFEVFIFVHGVTWAMLVAYGILTMLVVCDAVG